MVAIGATALFESGMGARQRSEFSAVKQARPVAASDVSTVGAPGSQRRCAAVLVARYGPEQGSAVPRAPVAIACLGLG